MDKKSLFEEEVNDEGVNNAKDVINSNAAKRVDGMKVSMFVWEAVLYCAE